MKGGNATCSKAGLQNKSLISVDRLADTGYYSIFMPGGEGVQVMDTNEAKVTINGDAVLRGGQDSHSLWGVQVGGESSNNTDIALTEEELNEAIHNVF